MGIDKKSDTLLGRRRSQRAGEDVREIRDSDRNAVFEMKSSKSTAGDANEDSAACQPATCERAGNAVDVD